MDSNRTAQYDYTSMIEGFKSHSPRYSLGDLYKKIKPQHKNLYNKNLSQNLVKIMLHSNQENKGINNDEQTEVNIKNFTKEGKSKILVWLPNFFDDKLSFKEMRKSEILEYLNGQFSGACQLI